MTDREPFITAIKAAPECDTHRLVYADFLQENDEPERAELIRVQCELAKPCPFGYSDAFHVDAVCPACDPPWRRERALLTAHPQLSVTCPVCKGHGCTILRNDCGHCAGAGHFPPVRGFVESASVPALATVFERKPYAEICREPEKAYWLTDWARAVLESHALLRRMPVGDREPYHNAADCWLWMKAVNNVEHASDALPGLVFDALADDIDIYNRGLWRTYRTPDLARDALAVAVCAVARGMMEVAHA